VEDGILAENRVAGDSVEEGAEHPRPPGNQSRILLGLVLLDGVLSHRRL